MAPKRLKGQKSKPKLKADEVEGLEEEVLTRQDSFLDMYAETASINKAARLSGVPVREHYTWAQNDTYDYSRRFAIAHDIACTTIEGEIARRGMEGVKKPLTFKGQLIEVGYTKDGELCEPTDSEAVRTSPLQLTEYSDALLQFYAKASMPDKYRERSSVDVTHSGSIMNMNEDELKVEERKLGIDTEKWELPTDS